MAVVWVGVGVLGGGGGEKQTNQRWLTKGVVISVEHPIMHNAWLRAHTPYSSMVR